jgi:hypothetical protein
MAIAALSAASRERVTPLIEVPEIGFDFETWSYKKTLDEHIKPFGKRVADKWGRACLVDLIHMPKGKVLANGAHPVTRVFDELRTRNCSAAPVTGITRDHTFQQAIGRVISTDNRGVCIRVTLTEAAKSDLKSMLDTLMDQLQVSPNECDVVFDLGAPNFEPIDGFTKLVHALLSRLPYQDSWQAITIMGTSFPETMAEVKSSPALLPRWEWLLYKRLAAKLAEQGARIPTFGDYGINHKDVPRVDMRLVKPSATIRYTIDDAWFIVKGPNVRDHGFEQYRNHCRTLTKSPYFRNSDFSMGDAYIQNCSLGKEKTGNLSTWRKVGTNQHLEKVVQDIANLFGP